MTGDHEEAITFEKIHALGPCHPSRGIVAALCEAAAVIVARDRSEWDYDDIRKAEHGPIVAVCCYACGQRDVRLIRHHIVQIQHGGSNRLRNIIAICQHCHAQIHPWLPAPIQGTDFFHPLAAVPRDLGTIE